jgi:hypothetical protein
MNALSDLRNIILKPVPQIPDPKNWYCRFRVNRYDTFELPLEVIQYEIEKMKKEAIYQAVNQTSGWISINPVLTENVDIMNDIIEYGVNVHVRPVMTKVYVFEDYNKAMLRDPNIPRDLRNCHWCGGYTKNDMRGHCAGCGGPRKHERGTNGYQEHW